MPILTAICVLAAALGQAPDAAVQKVTSELGRLETKLMGAAQLGNVADVEALVAPEFAFSMAIEGRPNEVLNRSEWIRSNEHFDLKSFEISSLTAHPFGGDVVITHFRLVRAARMGASVDMSGEFVMTDVWVRTKDRWQLTRRFVSRPAAVPPRK